MSSLASTCIDLTDDQDDTYQSSSYQSINQSNLFSYANEFNTSIDIQQDLLLRFEAHRLFEERKNAANRSSEQQSINQSLKQQAINAVCRTIKRPNRSASPVIIDELDQSTDQCHDQSINHLNSDNQSNDQSVGPIVKLTSRKRARFDNADVTQPESKRSNTHPDQSIEASTNHSTTVSLSQDANNQQVPLSIRPPVDPVTVITEVDQSIDSINPVVPYVSNQSIDRSKIAEPSYDLISSECDQVMLYGEQCDRDLMVGTMYNKLLQSWNSGCMRRNKLYNGVRVSKDGYRSCFARGKLSQIQFPSGSRLSHYTGEFYRQLPHGYGTIKYVSGKEAIVECHEGRILRMIDAKGKLVLKFGTAAGEFDAYHQSIVTAAAE